MCNTNPFTLTRVQRISWEDLAHTTSFIYLFECANHLNVSIHKYTLKFETLYIYTSTCKKKSFQTATNKFKAMVSVP